MQQPEERTHPAEPEQDLNAAPPAEETPVLPPESAKPTAGQAEETAHPDDTAADSPTAADAEEEPELILKGYYAGAPVYGKNKAAKPKKQADPRSYEERQREYATKRQGKRRVVFGALPLVAILVVVLLSYRTNMLLPNEGEQILSDQRLTDAQVIESPETAFSDLDGEQAQMLRETVDQVNQEREAQGLAPLVLEARLCSAARIRAAEAVETFSHTRPDGSSYQMAIARAGVQSGLTGEDIGTGYQSGADFVTALLKSDEHAAYIRSETYRYFGAGVAENPSDAKYKGFTFCLLFSQ